MSKRIDLTGKRFGKLVVLGCSTERHKTGRLVWKCLCDCGKETSKLGTCLQRGQTKSCGCYGDEFHKTHGKSKTPEYFIWQGILQRCNNEKATGYKNYGGRGISICERWLRFENFIADMEERPSPSHTIERIGNDGNYEPENCEWATNTEQRRNTRVSVRSQTGTTGVCLDQRSGKYRAQIAVNRKTIGLGLHTHLEDAIDARKMGEIKYWGKQH